MAIVYVAAGILAALPALLAGASALAPLAAYLAPDALGQVVQALGRVSWSPRPWAVRPPRPRGAAALPVASE